MNSIEISATGETLGSFYLCVDSTSVRWIIGLKVNSRFCILLTSIQLSPISNSLKRSLLLDTVNLTWNSVRISYELSRRYNYHPLHMVSYPFDQIQPDMSLAILDRQERVIRNKLFIFFKVPCKNRPPREATWETEESMRASYPHLPV